VAPDVRKVGAEVAVQQRNEKWQAAVARSAFSSQNDHFLKFRYPRMARRCGEKHVFRSKCTKTPHSWTNF